MSKASGEIRNYSRWLFCAIGDEMVDGISYSDIVDVARGYINEVGCFEKFA